MNTVLNAINSLSKIFAKISCLLCLFLVLLTAEQVVARYLFSSSTIALQELEWHFFGLSFLFAAPYTFKLDGHVRVDILYCKLSGKGRAIIDILGIIFLLIPLSLLLIYYGIDFTLLALGNTNPNSFDHYSAYYFNNSGALYAVFSKVEAFLRNTILVGEISPNPGGLEARWIIKAAIPLAFTMLFLQGVASLLEKIKFLRDGE